MSVASHARSLVALGISRQCRRAVATVAVNDSASHTPSASEASRPDDGKAVQRRIRALERAPRTGSRPSASPRTAALTHGCPRS